MSGLVLQAYFGEGPAGKPIVSSKQDKELDVNVDSQLWYLEDAGDGGYYYIVSKLNGLYMDVDGVRYAEGTPLIQWSKNSPPVATANQKWKIELKDGFVVSQLNGQVIELDPEKKTAFMSRRKEKKLSANQQWDFELCTWDEDAV